MHGNFVAAITDPTCACISRQSEEYTYGGSTIRPEQPDCSASFANVTAPHVESDEIAAMTGLLPATLTAVFRIAIFSSCSRVAPSPSEPSITRPAHPLPSCHAACCARKR